MCKKADVDMNKRAGELTEEEVREVVFDLPPVLENTFCRVILASTLLSVMLDSPVTMLLTGLRGIFKTRLGQFHSESFCFSME